MKVYTLLTLQLLFTAVIGYLGYNIPAFQQFFKSTPVVIVVSVGLIAITMVMACCIDLFRKYALPFFALFTVLLSILVAASICGFQSKVIMMAVAITLVLTISLTIYACITVGMKGRLNLTLQGAEFT